MKMDHKTSFLEGAASVSPQHTPTKKRRGIRNPFRHHHYHSRTGGRNGKSNTYDISTTGSDSDEELNEEVVYSYRRHNSTNPSASGIKNKFAAGDVDVLEQKKATSSQDERYLSVKPAYAYPRVKFTREELRKEMNKSSSYFHDLRQGDEDEAVGCIHMEVLQCFGLPRRDFRKKSSAFCILVCDRHAFKTDVIPPISNPMWLSKMRRACVFPLCRAFSRVYIGVFATGKMGDVFIGRVVVDVSRLRPGSTYDVTLPLRLSNQVYSRTKRGAIRFRMHLQWHDERSALLSYLTSTTPRFLPHDNITVKCTDNKAFQNVARVVHGYDVPGKFSMKLAKATTREINFIRIHVLRYIRKREIRNITQWRYPIISLFIFVAWMHSVYLGTLKYVPGHVLTYVLLHLWKNYTHYVIEGGVGKNFMMPTVEEMMGTLLFGKCIEPLQMGRREQMEEKANSSGGGDNVCDPPEMATLEEMAKEFKENVARSKRRRLSSQFLGDVNTFSGKDAVDFFVDMNYAASRKDAVELGKRMQRELRLFEHVRRKNMEFKDADVLYVLSSSIESSEFVVNTHKPWFRSISRLFFPKTDEGCDYIEFPYGDADHPRFTVDESIVDRSRESVNVLASMQGVPGVEEDDQENDDDDAVGVDDVDLDATEIYTKEGLLDSFSSNLTDLQRTNSDSSQENSSSLLDSAILSLSPTKKKRNGNELEIDLHTLDENVEDYDEDMATSMETEIITLQKPPKQDINLIEKKDKTLPQVLEDVSVQIHTSFGHLFHDKAYRLRVDGVQDSSSSDDQLSSFMGKKQLLRKASSTLSSSVVKPSRVVIGKELESREDEAFLLKTKKDQYDKLLRSGRYSSNNVIMAKVATVVQPIVEIAQTFLASFRAVFNIMTWRDPFLTFWVALCGILLVIILHCFPWRIMLGIIGVVFVGPQNWILRIFRERESLSSGTEDLDLIIRKKKQDSVNWDDPDRPDSLFSSYAPDNRPFRPDSSSIIVSDIKEVAVPLSQLMYRRCYDWPPEPEYARVRKGAPPNNEPEAERLLELDQLDTYGETLMSNASDHCSKDGSSTSTTTWARRISTSVKHVPTKIRGGPKKSV